MRHGAPETPGLLLGRTDALATHAGIANCLARAQGVSFGAVISSDLQRCERPASAIAAAGGGGHQTDSRWRELDFGAWDGLAPDAVDSGALAAFHADPDANPPPAGERWSALVARVGAALDQLAPADTLVVTHGGAIRAALSSLFGFGQGQLWAFHLPYACVVSIRIWPESQVGTRAGAQIVGLQA